MTAQIGTDGAGLMRRAVADACNQLQERLRPMAVQLLAGAGVPDVDGESVRFTPDGIQAGAHSNLTISFSELVENALRRRTNLAAIGFFRTPNLWWDREVGAGWPFAGFLFGAATVEVQLDAFTGEVQVLQADVVYPGGGGNQADSDGAQVARALNLGLGWMLNETVRWDESGKLVSDSGQSYAIPGFGDAPLRLNLEMTPLPGDPAENCAASGAESAVVLAGAAREAVRDAIRSFGAGKEVEVDLPIPATPEAVLRALRDMSRQLAEVRRKGES
jgi:xanthine dehydrogenase large subunit